jgi:hypothetical protein
MNKGVEILLNRMDSHPEEFVYSPRDSRATLSVSGKDRWHWVIHPMLRRMKLRHTTDDTGLLELPWLADDEVETLYKKFMQLQRDAFTKAVMAELLQEGGGDGEGRMTRNVHTGQARSNSLLNPPF